MHRRNIYFTLVEVRPSQDKLKRFHNVVPLFRQGKIWLNKSLIGTTFMTEMIAELERATVSGFKSRHDDALDTVSMLSEMKPWKPQSYAKKDGSLFEDPFYEEVEDNYEAIGSYIV
jgi:phage terminase large subunit-like protein